MPTVFVPHLAFRKDTTAGGAPVPVKDISSAAKFGNLRTVVESSTPGNPIISSCQPQIASIMSDFREGDYILAIGSPVIIAACAMEAAKTHSEVQFLRWARELGEYVHEKVIL